jgi:hypothetical protein
MMKAGEFSGSPSCVYAVPSVIILIRATVDQESCCVNLAFRVTAQNWRFTMNVVPTAKTMMIHWTNGVTTILYDGEPFFKCYDKSKIEMQRMTMALIQFHRSKQVKLEKKVDELQKTVSQLGSI